MASPLEAELPRSSGLKLPRTPPQYPHTALPTNFANNLSVNIHRPSGVKLSGAPPQYPGFRCLFPGPAGELCLIQSTPMSSGLKLCREPRPPQYYSVDYGSFKTLRIGGSRDQVCTGHELNT